MAKKNGKGGVAVESPANPLEGLRLIKANELISPDKVHLPSAELTGRYRPVDDESVISLADSMNVQAGGQGQQQAIQVRPIPGTEGEYTVVFGITRKRAADLIQKGYTSLINGKEKGKEQAPQPNFLLRCDIVDIDDATAFKRNVVENVQRNGVSYMSNAQNQQELRDKFGMSDAAITKLYGYAHQASVTRLKKLLTLPTDVQDGVDREFVTLQAAFELADFLKDEGPAAFDTVWNSISGRETNEKDIEKTGDSIGVIQVRDAIKAFKDKRKADAKAGNTGAENPAPAIGEGGSESPVAPAGEGGTVAPSANGTAEEKGKALTLKQVKEMLTSIQNHQFAPAKAKELAGLFMGVITGEIAEPEELGRWMSQNLSTPEELEAHQQRINAGTPPADVPAETASEEAVTA